MRLPGQMQPASRVQTCRSFTMTYDVRSQTGPHQRESRKTRPFHHHKRESIEAHVTIVFAAMAVSHFIGTQTGWSTNKFVRTARRYRTVQIKAGRQILTAADPLPDDLREALATTNDTKMSEVSRPAPGGRAVGREDSAVVTCCARVGRSGIILGVRRGCPRKDLGALSL
jgi:hypothetical protein